MKRSYLVLALMLIGLARPALAQVQGGTVSGTVLDEQGAVLPGVAVTLQGADANRESVTEADGRFRFLDLAPGPYTLTVALQGFSTIVNEAIVVSVGKTVDLPLTMKVASVAETINVSGDAPIVDTKATGTAVNFTADELTATPRITRVSRSDWSSGSRTGGWRASASRITTHVSTSAPPKGSTT